MDILGAAIPVFLVVTLIIVQYARKVAEERKVRRYIYLVHTMRR